jgi:hypothetical protein
LSGPTASGNLREEVGNSGSAGTRFHEARSPDALARRALFEAMRLCHDRRIRHIPILEDDRLVGIVSDRDLRDVSLPLGDSHRVSTMKEKRVGDVMTLKVVKTHPQKISAYDRTLLFHLIIKDPSSVVRSLEGAGFEVSWSDNTVPSDEVAR